MPNADVLLAIISSFHLDGYGTALNSPGVTGPTLRRTLYRDNCNTSPPLSREAMDYPSLDPLTSGGGDPLACLWECGEVIH